MKRLTFTDIQKYFKFDGNEAVQKELERMFIMLSATEDGQQLLKDIISNPEIKKPIHLSEGKLIDGFLGESCSNKSQIVLSEILPQPGLSSEEKYFKFLDHVTELSHELFHIKTSPEYQKNLFIPFQWQIYNYLVDEARTYAYEHSVITKAIQDIQSGITANIPNRDELIFQRMSATGDYARSVKKYIDAYLKRYCDLQSGFYTLKSCFAVQKFQKEMTRLLGIKNPIHLKDCSWYIPSKKGGYYLCGQNRFVEFNKDGRPIYSCEKLQDDSYRSTILSEKSMSFSSLCPTKWLQGKYSHSQAYESILVDFPKRIRRFTSPRPITEHERLKLVRDFDQHRELNEKVLDNNIIVPKNCSDLKDVILWREKQDSSKTSGKKSRRVILKDHGRG